MPPSIHFQHQQHPHPKKSVADALTAAQTALEAARREKEERERAAREAAEAAEQVNEHTHIFMLLYVHYSVPGAAWYVFYKRDPATPPRPPWNPQHTHQNLKNRRGSGRGQRWSASSWNESSGSCGSGWRGRSAAR